MTLTDTKRLCACGCGAVVEGNPQRLYASRTHYQAMWRKGRTLAHRRTGTTAHQITLRLTREELVAAYAAAQRANLTLASWTSQLVIDTLRLEKNS